MTDPLPKSKFEDGVSVLAAWTALVVFGLAVTLSADDKTNPPVVPVRPIPSDLKQHVAETEKPKIPPSEKSQPDENAGTPDSPAEDSPESKQSDGQNATGPDATDEAVEERPGFLNRLFERLFLPERMRTNRSQNDSEEKGGTARRRMDPRAPFDARLTTLMNKAQGHVKVGESRLALESIQRILEQPEDAVWEAGRGKLISLRTAAQRLLGKLPQKDLDRYRLQYEATAKNLLQEAKGKGGAAIAQVAMRYFHTESGQTAANLLASIHFDRGEFALAARWMEELLLAEAPITKSEGWRLKAQFVAHQLTSPRLQKLFQGKETNSSGSAKIGGNVVESKEWISALPSVTFPQPPMLQDWPQFFGSAKRIGRAGPVEPFLLKRWIVRMTGSAPVQERLATLVQDLRDNDQSPILCFQPLFVKGKVIFRSLRGVKVIDAATGRLLWETADEWPVEDLLSHASVSANPTELEGPQILAAFAQAGMSQEEFENLPVTDHPLTHLLFRNANYGLLSSDGERLYVIEDQSIMTALQPGQYLGEDIPDTDAFGRTLGTNRLTAYDLATGRSLWETGGPPQQDPFPVPMAGTFFFGPPVIDSNESFVIAETDGTISLCSLDPKTGKTNWTQVIAHAQAKINIDVGRQWLPAQVAVGDGVIVCPTTVGWMVALNRMTRSILWAYRYTEEKSEDRSEPADEAVPPAELNERWGTAPPVIAGDRVIFTPPTESEIICLGLADGSRLWRHARGSSVYLAGVFGNQVVIVDEESIYALSLITGVKQWSTKFPKQDSRPSGHGIALGNEYWVPLVGGDLVSVEITSGKLGRTISLPASTDSSLRQFGNLGMYNGMLMTLTPQGIIAFEPKLSIENDLKEQLAKDPNSWKAMIRTAELDLLKGQFANAIQALRNVDVNRLPADSAEYYRTTLQAVLSNQVREDLKSRDKEFEELMSLTVTPVEIQKLEMLRIERLLHRRDYIGAFESLLTFNQRFFSSTLSMSDSEIHHVRGSAWVRGTLEEIWKQFPDDVQQTLDQRVKVLATEAQTREVLQQSHFSVAFGFHPAAHQLARQKVEEFAATGHWQAAENELCRLRQVPSERIWADERLAQLALQAGSPMDADYYLEQLELTLRQMPDNGGMSPTNAVAKVREKMAIPATKLPFGAKWQNRDLEVQRVGCNFEGDSALTHVNLHGAALPFFQQNRLQVVGQEARFEVVDIATERKLWSVPVRSPEHIQIHAHVCGHQVLLSDSHNLTALSPTERKILWTHTVEYSAPNEQFEVAETSDIPQHMFRISPQINRRRPLQERDSGIANLRSSRVVFNHNYVAYINRKSLVVLDSTTGTELWRREGLATGLRIVGGSSRVYTLDDATENITAYRAIDGQEIDSPALQSHVSHTIAIVDDDLIVADRLNRDGTRLDSIQRINPFTNVSAWKLEFPVDAYLVPISGERLAVLETSGDVKLVDLQRGTVKSFGKITKSSIRRGTEYYAIPTFNQLLIVSHREGDFSGDHYSETFNSLRLAGQIHAFDIHSGALLWHNASSGMHLILDTLDYSPLVLLVSRTFEQNGGGNWRLSIKAMDRQQGRVVLETEIPVQSSFHQLSVNLKEEFVEMRSYNDRLRLTPKVAPRTAP